MGEGEREKERGREREISSLKSYQDVKIFLEKLRLEQTKWREKERIVNKISLSLSITKFCHKRNLSGLSPYDMLFQKINLTFLFTDLQTNCWVCHSDFNLAISTKIISSPAGFRPLVVEQICDDYFLKYRGTYENKREEVRNREGEAKTSKKLPYLKVKRKNNLHIGKIVM